MPARTGTTTATLAVVASLLACSTTPLAEAPRPVATIAPALTAFYALPGPVIEETLAAVGGDRDLTRLRGVLRSGDELAHVHLFLPPRQARRPFVLCLPILAGGRELIELVAMRLCHQGFASGWCERAGSALREPQRAPELDDLLRRTILHNRMLLAWVRAQPAEFDPQRTGLFGISLGGFLGSALLALEPSLQGGVLCISGSGLPELAVESLEPRAIRWREFRRRSDGLVGDQLRQELAAGLHFSASRFAPAVDPARVFLIHADLDQVVPRRFQDRLWEELGRPRRLRLHLLGHYSAALALDPVLDAAGDFLRRKLGRGPAAGE